MLKLDTQKLISERGLPALGMFDKVKFPILHEDFISNDEREK